MILKRAIYYVTAVVALAATAVVCVVFLALALHAGLTPVVGEAWAGVLVAAAAAALAGIIGMVLLMLANPPRRRHKREQDKDLTSRMFELAQAKPWVALGVVGAVAAVALKNPRTTATVVSALMAGRASKS
ncbi:hypothetical protein [Phenylobacterium sp.]|uniref:hypothetical protein n=1 Tax=Phenylobacterium sp. TaxID=1871053 RepID=UPI00289AE97B|nr:hypothetical protein [Phenylobacterium sp.]